MEIPYQIEHLFRIDNQGYAILNYSSLIKYAEDSDIYYLSQVIDLLGISSNRERHLYKPITTSNKFFNNNGNKKTLLFKIEKNVIIGFIFYEYKPIVLRNEFNFNAFEKVLLSICDFYVFSSYQRMNTGKELFDFLIKIENVKPVSMAFEFPSKAMYNFLYKYYNLNNPIYHDNNVITYCFFSDKNFNKYLDNYHRPIDVFKIENDIDSYRKFSPLSRDFKIYNSHYTYKNIFPLNFKSNRIKITNDRYSDRKNFENIFLSKKLNNKTDKNQYNNLEHSYDFQNHNNMYRLQANDEMDKKYNNYILNQSTQLNNNYDDQVNQYTNNDNIQNFKKDEYYSKFNDYYFIDNSNSNSNPNPRNSYNNYIKNNYFNHINDESKYFKNLLYKQREKNDKLSENIHNLTNRIKTHSYRSPQKNGANKDFYYRRNRSYATLFDSIQNKNNEENDFNEYKKKQIQEYYSYK